MSSSSVKVTIDSSPRRRLRQNADTEPAPGNLPAMPTIAIALSGSASGSAVKSIVPVTVVVLPFAGLRLVDALRHAAVPDRGLRGRVSCGSDRPDRVDR